MKNQIQRHLKTEDFYQEIIALIPEETLKKVSETYVRGKLDAILSMGKIEGRLTAFADGHTRHRWPEYDRLIEGWQRIVDSTSISRERADSRTTFEYTAVRSDVRGMIVTVHNVDRHVGVVEDGRDLEEAFLHARRAMVDMGVIDKDQQVLFVERKAS